MSSGPTICCIPVTGGTGLGELARVLTLSHSLRERWPQARFHFVICRTLPASARARIPEDISVTWLETSPTYDNDGVVAALEQCRPDLVLFDNAGTAQQVRHAKRLGARTVFLSTRAFTRRRGLQLSWLPWLDQHWVVEPGRLDGGLNRWQRLKLALPRSPKIRTIQSLYRPTVAERRRRLQAQLGCADRRYVCFVPGGGGGEIGARSAVSVFAAAAEMVAAETKLPCLLLQGPGYEGPDVAAPGVTIRRASHEETVDLMEDAHLVVVGASSSLFQALAQKRVCVATSSGGREQLSRARAWGSRGVVEPADPDAASLATAACRVLDDPIRWQQLQQRVTALAIRNDLARAVDLMMELLAVG